MADFHITGDTSLDASGLNKGLDSMAVAAGNIIANVAGTVVNGAKDMIASAMQTGIAFDSAMSQVAATMGVTKDSIGDLTEFAKEMGSTTQFTATQAAEGLNYLALAGYSADQSMATLPSVLNLAAAGGMELAAASDMVTDAMSALGLEADAEGKNVTAFGDQLAKTASSSNTSVSQLGQAILTVGGTAKNLAGGTTELNAALGILADNGIKGAEGGTALRNVILALATPTDQAAAMMDSLGVKAYDADGSLRPLNETFGDLDAVLSQMSDAEKNDVLSTLFNKVDLKSANALLANCGERFDQLSGAIADSDGAMAQMAETMMDNLGGSLTYLGSAADGLKLAVFDSLSGIANEGVKYATTAITALTDGFKENGVAGMIDAAFAIATGFVESLTESLSGDSTDMVAAALAAVTSFTESLRGNVGSLVDAGLAMIQNLVQGLADNLPNLIAYAPTIISNLAGCINDNGPKILKAGIQIILTLVKGIIQSIPTLVSNAPKIVKAVVDVITAFNWINLGGTIVKGLANGVSGAISAVKNAVKSIIKAFTEGGWKDVGANIIKGIANGITGAVGKVADAAKTAAKSALNAAKSFLGIHSPSKRAEDEVGEQYDAGIARGVERNTDLMIDAAKDSADDMISAAQDTVMERQIMTGRNIVGTGTQPQHLTGGGAAGRGDERILERLERIERAVEAGKNLYLDGKTLVGGTAKRMNAELGKIAIRERGVKA